MNHCIISNNLIFAMNVFHKHEQIQNKSKYILYKKTDLSNSKYDLKTIDLHRI